MTPAVRAHLDVLRDRVFQSENKWPQFRLLLRDLEELSNDAHPASKVLVMERTLLYGGVSLIAPVFSGCDVVSLDCSPASADGRGGYNKDMVDDERFIRVPVTRRAPAADTGMPDAAFDLVLLPNLVHHIADQEGLFREAARVVKPGGKVYVFEALVRELHQVPDDYLRYTPYGLERVLASAGLEPEPFKVEGGPFSVITYCWVQALEYLPEVERNKLSEWFYERHFEELMDLDSRYKTNRVRQNTSFPMSFSIAASRL